VRRRFPLYRNLTYRVTYRNDSCESADVSTRTVPRRAVLGQRAAQIWRRRPRLISRYSIAASLTPNPSARSRMTTDSIAPSA
jgi:hypothetical protein